jgi:3-oxoacyl-(acyl-carrier-protein) synthase
MNKPNNSRRVVITGMGVVSPIGNNLADFTYSLANSISGISFIPELKKNNFRCQVGGLCKITNDELKEISIRLKIPIISRSTLLLTKAAIEALINSGLDKLIETGNTSDIDIIIGSTTGPGDLWGENIIPMVDTSQHLKLGSYAFEQIIHSSPAAMLSGLIGSNGRVISNSLACAGSTEAIAMAYKMIKNDNKNLIIAGGTEAYSKYYWATMDAMRITNPNYNSNPEKASRPLSASARGFVPAEGSGILILEEYNHAIERGAKIFAEIIGENTNCGGQRNGGSMTASNPIMLEKCIKDAIISSGIKPKAIDYISGHLTGTKADIVEINAWKNVMSSETKHFPFVNSLKSLMGHAIGAAGVIETIAAVIQIKEEFIHASINCEDLNPDIETLISSEKIVRETKHNIKIRYFAKANFGFGDVNSCLILKNHHE